MVSHPIWVTPDGQGVLPCSTAQAARLVEALSTTLGSFTAYEQPTPYVMALACGEFLARCSRPSA